MAMDNSIALLWDSLWQGPKVVGMLFGAILIASLFVIRAVKVYRERVSNGNQCKKVSDKYKGRRLKHIQTVKTITRMSMPIPCRSVSANFSKRARPMTMA